jgi:hypothetical protein
MLSGLEPIEHDTIVVQAAQNSTDCAWKRSTTKQELLVVRESVSSLVFLITGAKPRLL